MKKNKKNRKNLNKTEKKPVSEFKKTGRAFASLIKRRFGIIVAIACFVVVVVGINLGINAMSDKDSEGTYYPPGDSVAAANDQSLPEYTRAPVSDFVDLTLLSSTMIYAEVYNIMTYPEDYMGKTIKMNGLYAPMDSGNFLLIEDASACCQQGLEFIWNGEHIYPDDYPSANTHIEVVGIFDSYEDEFGGIRYYVAVDDIFVNS